MKLIVLLSTLAVGSVVATTSFAQTSNTRRVLATQPNNIYEFVLARTSVLSKSGSGLPWRDQIPGANSVVGTRKSRGEQSLLSTTKSCQGRFAEAGERTVRGAASGGRRHPPSSDSEQLLRFR